MAIDTDIDTDIDTEGAPAAPSRATAFQRRDIYISKNIWQRARIAATRRGETVSKLIRRAIVAELSRIEGTKIDLDELE